MKKFALLLLALSCVSFRTSLNAYGEVILSLICPSDHDLKSALENGGDPNERHTYGNRALHLCIIHSDYKSAQLLLNAHADLTLRNDDGKTPLELAIFLERREIEQLIRSYMTAPVAVALSKPTTDVQLKKKHVMAQPVAAALSRPTIDEQFMNGHMMAKPGVLIQDMLESGADALSELLSRGENPNDQGREGTILHYAIQHDDVECVVILLNAPGIDLSLRNKHGLTPLQFAKKRKNEQIVALIEERINRYKKA